MYEVEAKISIQKGDIAPLKKRLEQISDFKKKYHQKDNYYGDLESHIRIRNNDSKEVLTIKNKRWSKGIEINQEVEFTINSTKEFKKIIKKADIPFFASKEKISNVYQKGNFRIEINEVKKLGFFLEIEACVDKKESIKEVKLDLINLFNQLGFKNTPFNKKYYLQQLAELKSN